jgi:hypothetical protein
MRRDERVFEAMARRRRVSRVLFVTGVALGLGLLAVQQHVLTASPWLTSVAGRLAGVVVVAACLLAAKHVVRCPACGGLQDARPSPVCGHCRIALRSDAPLAVPTEREEADARGHVTVVLQGVEKARSYRRRTRILIAVPALAIGAWVWRGGHASPAFVALDTIAAYAMLWFFLVETPASIFETVLWKRHGRCPRCRREFPAQGRGYPGSADPSVTVPKVCDGCGCRLTPAP